MKTAILKTNIWDDDDFYDLNIDTKLLYLLLLSSPERGMSDVYKVSDRILSARSGLNSKQIDICKKQLTEAGLVMFFNNYVKLTDISYVQPTTGRFTAAALESKIKTRPAKGGGEWKYVEGSYVTQVLNSLFGFMWSFEVVTPMSDIVALIPTGSITVQGRLKVKIGDEWVTKEQYGRKEIAFKKGTRDPLDFGNDMKAAATDAKKKCASELGLFADVYSQDNFFEAEIIENGISPSEIMDEVSKLETSKEILEYSFTALISFSISSSISATFSIISFITSSSRSTLLINNCAFSGISSP